MFDTTFGPGGTSLDAYLVTTEYRVADLLAPAVHGCMPVSWHFESLTCIETVLVSVPFMVSAT